MGPFTREVSGFRGIYPGKKVEGRGTENQRFAHFFSVTPSPSTRARRVWLGSNRGGVPVRFGAGAESARRPLGKRAATAREKFVAAVYDRRNHSSDRHRRSQTAATPQESPRRNPSPLCALCALRWLFHNSSYSGASEPARGGCGWGVTGATILARGQGTDAHRAPLHLDENLSRRSMSVGA